MESLTNSGTSTHRTTGPSPEQIAFGGHLCNSSLMFYESCLLELMQGPWRNQNRDAVAAALAEIIQDVTDGDELSDLITNNPSAITMEQFRKLVFGFGLSLMMSSAIKNYQQKQQ